MYKPHNTRIVGIVGNHGSGKSTLAQELVKHFQDPRYYLHAYQVSFADALREELSSILPQPLTRQKHHPYEREALVFVGESWRKQNPQRYVRKFLEKVAAQRDFIRPNLVFVDDVYHYNEREVCDLVLYLANKNYTLPQGYLPVSVRETLSMLEEAEALPWSLYYEIEEPKDIDRYKEDLLKVLAAWTKQQFQKANIRKE